MVLPGMNGEWGWAIYFFSGAAAGTLHLEPPTSTLSPLGSASIDHGSFSETMTLLRGADGDVKSLANPP